MGKKVKEGKRQRAVLSPEEEQSIVSNFNAAKEVEDLSVVVTTDEIIEKNYSFSAGQYFEIKIDYIDITEEEFQEKLNGFEGRLTTLFKEGKELDKEIQENFTKLKMVK